MSKKIAVLFGGTAAEREVSLKSGNAVLEALRARGVNATGIDTRELDINGLKQFDAAFIAVHGRGGEDGSLQGLLELVGLPYTGSGVMASAIGMDKVRTKLLWQACGLSTAGFRAYHHGNAWVDQLVAGRFPLMVKPAREGSSIGMGKANDEAQLEAALAKAQQYDRDVIVEEWIDGPEYTVAILGNRALPPIRLQTTAEFYDYEAKYIRNDTKYLCPCGLDAAREQELQQLAVAAFNAVGCRGWGRVDVMMGSDGKFRLLEVNTVPGMTDHSLVPMAARAAGLDFGDLVLNILKESGITP
ncbi:MAG: D-alanine--D-alanine ligase [Gammaproteobacteria bacterium]